MTINEQMIELVNEIINIHGDDYIITLDEISQLMFKKYGTKSGSVIPSDYCYNRVNNGIQIEKKPAVFEFLGNGKYKCLGLNYPYNGAIYHKPKGQSEIIVGKCINGVRQIAPSEDSKYQSVNDNKKVIINDNTIKHKTSRDPSMKLRFEVLKRDNFKCCACGASPAKDPSVELHVDHIVPWSKGGETIADNLQTLCSICNLGKRDTI